MLVTGTCPDGASILDPRYADEMFSSWRVSCTDEVYRGSEITTEDGASGVGGDFTPNDELSGSAGNDRSGGGQRKG